MIMKEPGDHGRRMRVSEMTRVQTSVITMGVRWLRMTDQRKIPSFSILERMPGDVTRM